MKIRGIWYLTDQNSMISGMTNNLAVGHRFNRNCATDWDNLEKAKLRNSAIFPKMYVPFMVPTICHNNGGKKCP